VTSTRNQGIAEAIPLTWSITTGQRLTNKATTSFMGLNSIVEGESRTRGGWPMPFLLLVVRPFLVLEKGGIWPNRDVERNVRQGDRQTGEHGEPFRERNPNRKASTTADGGIAVSQDVRAGQTQTAFFSISTTLPIPFCLVGCFLCRVRGRTVSS
jgi:hypothetical protein